MDTKLNYYGKLCSKFYDSEKKYAKDTELDFYSSFAKKSDRILEAMCGSGRLLIPLIQRGYNVDGVDNSEQMLKNCSDRCSKLNLSPKIYCASISNFSSEFKYDLVTIAVGSFQLIVDRDEAIKSLKNLHKHMQIGGTLLIDSFTPDMEVESRNIRMTMLDCKTAIRHSVRYIFHPDQKLADAFCTYELVVSGVTQEVEHEFMQTTWYSDQEFKDLLAESGFELINIHEKTLRSTGPTKIMQAKAV